METASALLPETQAVQPPVRLRRQDWPRFWPVIAYLAAHVPMALAMARFSPLSTLHALAVVLGGVCVAAFSRRRVQAAWAGAYIVGSETLWRMTKADVFWEFGKYATCLVLIVALLRRRRFKHWLLPTLYFLLLLPSAVTPLLAYDWYESRRFLSFNLSGPLALMVATIYFAQLKLSRGHLIQLLLVFFGPVIGMVTVILFKMQDTEISFGHGSNVATSGGFGPNQVSAALGFACVAAFFCVFEPKLRKSLRAVSLLAMLACAGQSALTFSRCGLYYACGTIAIIAFFLMKNIRQMLQFFGLGLVVALAFYFIVFPRLDAFTGGALSERFMNTDLTGRDEIMMADLKIMAEYPVLGAGVGMGTYLREQYYNAPVVSHTEFTRLLAEHGSLGIAAILVLVFIGAGNVWHMRTVRGRAFSAGMVAYSVAFMAGNGMRLALPSFIFGLAAARLLPELKRRIAPRPPINNEIAPVGQSAPIKV